MWYTDTEGKKIRQVTNICTKAIEEYRYLGSIVPILQSWGLPNDCGSVLTNAREEKWTCEGGENFCRKACTFSCSSVNCALEVKKSFLALVQYGALVFLVGGHIEMSSTLADQ